MFSGSKFDNYFVVAALLKLERADLGFNMICCESRVIEVSLKAVKLFFRDRYTHFFSFGAHFFFFSYQYLPQPLRALPKAFNLKYEKTFFPYGRLTTSQYKRLSAWPSEEEFEVGEATLPGHF